MGKVAARGGGGFASVQQVDSLPSAPAMNHSQCLFRKPHIQATELPCRFCCRRRPDGNFWHDESTLETADLLVQIELCVHLLL